MGRTKTQLLGGEGEFKRMISYTDGSSETLKGQWTTLDYRSVMQDEPAIGHGGPFSVHRHWYTPVAFTIGGKIWWGGQLWTLQNFPLLSFHDNNPNTYPAHIPDPELPSLTELAVLCLKRTNPSKPRVDIPVSIAELRELPDLVRTAGRRFIDQMASANLKVEFGIKPMISDVMKLLDFTKRVENRVKLLKKLQQGSLLRKVDLYDSTVEEGKADREYPLLSSGELGHVQGWRLRTVTTRKVWGYVEYYPSELFNAQLGNDDAIRAKARQIILGLTVDYSTTWNLLPWSWLADWFSNIGDYLEAHRNLVPIRHGTPRIMVKTYTEAFCGILSSRYEIYRPEDGPSYTLRYVTKSRDIASASLPEVSLPFLTKRQWGILSSLAVLKRPR